MKALLIILLVVAVLVGGILTLLSTRKAGLPDREVLDRAKDRAREQSAKDDSDS